jgi:hypothetical protein
VSWVETVEKVMMFTFNKDEKGYDVSVAKLSIGGKMSSCLELEAG